MSKHPVQSQADSIKLKTSASSVDLEVRGNAAARTADALLSLVSPFTNAAGWVGDRLAEARINAALRAVRKATEQLKKEGISSAHIPPKVFLPWLEGASLETEDESEDLADAWAGLFVRAAKSSDAATISYIETLKKLGKDEAELLEFFATDTSPFYSEKFYELDGLHIFSDKNPLRKHALKKIAQFIKGNNEVELGSFIEHWGIQGMCQIIFYSCAGVRMRQTEYFREHEHAISNLEHLGLISIKTKTIKTAAGNIEIIWFEITKYAFDLIWACKGKVTGYTAFRPEEFVSISELMKEADGSA
jgi:hypothetical protein